MKQEHAKTLLGLIQMGAKGLQVANAEHKYLLQAVDILRHAADEPDAELKFANSWI